jgi:hypothetical protein
LSAAAGRLEEGFDSEHGLQCTNWEGKGGMRRRDGKARREVILDKFGERMTETCEGIAGDRGDVFLVNNRGEGEVLSRDCFKVNL